MVGWTFRHHLSVEGLRGRSYESGNHRSLAYREKVHNALVWAHRTLWIMQEWAPFFSPGTPTSLFLPVTVPLRRSGLTFKWQKKSAQTQQQPVGQHKPSDMGHRRWSWKRWQTRDSNSWCLTLGNVKYISFYVFGFIILLLLVGGGGRGGGVIAVVVVVVIVIVVEVVVGGGVVRKKVKILKFFHKHRGQYITRVTAPCAVVLFACSLLWAHLEWVCLCLFVSANNFLFHFLLKL